MLTFIYNDRTVVVTDFTIEDALGTSILLVRAAHYQDTGEQLSEIDITEMLADMSGIRSIDRLTRAS